jgi:transcriptional regulator with XRE-family HTH domain
MSSSLGRQIARCRKQAGLSQKDLAAFVGISSAALSQYEKGKREPNLLVITSLARALNTTIDALLGLKPLPDLVAQNRDEYALLRNFRGLNALGQKRILGDIAGLGELPKYSGVANEEPLQQKIILTNNVKTVRKKPRKPL